MPPAFVESASPVTLVGGAAVAPGALEQALEIAPFLVAADGGGEQALAAGYRPRAVIGDMDSLPQALADTLDPQTILAIAEQDSTDFDKALRHTNTPLVLAVGFTGGRIDHELAMLNSLVRQPAGHVVVIGADDLVFHAPRQFTIALAPGTRVSFFPLMPVSGQSDGLRWPIEGIAFAPGGRIGTSNAMAGDHLRWTFDGEGMLAILPRAQLKSVVAALLA
ncbi:MAG: thiamine diphosphokinase [Pseudomonadota bacterium]